MTALILAFASLATYKRKLLTGAGSRSSIGTCVVSVLLMQTQVCQCHCKWRRQRDLVESICIKKCSLLWRHLESLSRRTEVSELRSCGLSSIPGCLAQALVIKRPRMLFTTLYTQFYETVTNIMSLALKNTDSGFIWFKRSCFPNKQPL